MFAELSSNHFCKVAFRFIPSSNLILLNYLHLLQLIQFSTWAIKNLK